jgi:hypothetical protein
MTKLILGLTAFFMIGSGASSQPGQDANEVATRFGVLSVDEDKRLLFKGQPLNPPIDGNNILELGEVMSIGATDVVLVTDIDGSGCPYLYYFVSVSGSGVKATLPFGTCAVLTSLKAKRRLDNAHYVRFSWACLFRSRQTQSIQATSHFRLSHRRADSPRQTGEVRSRLKPNRDYNPSHKCLESRSLILTVSLLWFNFRIARDSRATR